MEGEILLIKISSVGVGSLQVDEYQPISSILAYAPGFMHPFINEPVLYILEGDDGEIIAMQGDVSALTIDPKVFAEGLKTAEELGTMLYAARSYCCKLGDYRWGTYEPSQPMEKLLLQ